MFFLKSFVSKKFKFAAALALAALIGAGCGKVKVAVHHETGDNWDYPETVAILPFSYETAVEENKNSASILRDSFFNYFSYLGYNDLPLTTVDLKLEPTIKTGVSAKDISNEELKKILGVDAIIQGHVINSTNLTYGIYAETSIEAELKMIDLRTGELLWDTMHTELNASSIVTPSLIDMIEDQAANSMASVAYHRIAESFSLKVLAKIPDPASLRYDKIKLPHIESVEANIKGNKLKPNDLIYVTMKGEPALIGHFDIGSFKAGIIMKEVSPGLYTGSYRIKEGDLIDGALIIATLSNKKGLTAKKFYKKALAIKKTQKLSEKNEH